jgi:hypothetical protein
MKRLFIGVASITCIGISIGLGWNLKSRQVSLNYQKAELIKELMGLNEIIKNACEKPDSFEKAKACYEYPQKQMIYIREIRQTTNDKDALFYGEAALNLFKDTAKILTISKDS